MPPVRAPSADPELFTETFSLASLVGCGKSLLGGTPGRVAAAALVVYAAAAVAVPGTHRVDSPPAVDVVAAPVAFVPKRAPVLPTHRQPSSKPAALARPTPQPARPTAASTPAPVRPVAPAPAHRPARPAPPAPRASHPRAPSPVPAAPPAAPTAPDPPPAEAPALPVVPPLPPLPPVTDPQQPDVDRPSLPLGP